MNKFSQSRPSARERDEETVHCSSTEGGASLTKTPLYQAMRAAQYQRQALIAQIREKWGRRLICYVSGTAALIDRDDTVGFVDLLHNVPRGEDLDLLLHTSGGDIDAAEKLISIVRTTVAEKCLRVIVPDFAKSAGTLMALGADRIVMSDTSELGPIDPQITLNDGQGNRIQYPVQSYLDAYTAHSAALQNNPADIVAQIMLGKLDPARVKLFEAARNRARTFAEEQLRRWMFRTQQGNVTEIAGKLLDTNRFLSHGQMINWEDAKQIGLLVDHLDSASDQWQQYWQLYCLQRLAVRDRQKLFESECVSLPFDAPS
jgi:ATP-dependent protease ClpP protease subunit